jgi:polyferredoxin
MRNTRWSIYLLIGAISIFSVMILIFRSQAGNRFGQGFAILGMFYAVAAFGSAIFGLFQRDKNNK